MLVAVSGFESKSADSSLILELLWNVPSPGRVVVEIHLMFCSRRKPDGQPSTGEWPDIFRANPKRIETFVVSMTKRQENIF